MSEELHLALERLLGPRPHAARPTDIPADGKIARLLEYAERAIKRCPFALGDIVTPRRGGIYRDDICGQPCVVIEIIDPPHITKNGEIGSFEELRRIDIRVAEYQPQSDSVAEKVGGSWEYERWEPKERTDG